MTTTPCSDRQTDAVGAALDCELPTGHEGAHEAHTTPDVTVTWTGAAGAVRDDRALWERAYGEEIAALKAAHEAHRLALSEALGLGTGAPWDAILDRAATIKAAAYERADLLETARDALSTAGQNGPHADDWPAIAPGIEVLAVERDEALKRAAELEQAERRAADAEAAITRVRAVAGWAINGWSDLSPKKVLAALDGTGDAAPSRPAATGEVQGVCPACGSSALFLGEGGYVTCAREHCPQPDAASTLLEQPAEPEAPCFHPSWETEATIGGRRCTDCGEWLDPQPPAHAEPAAPADPWPCDDCGATVPAGQTWCTAPACPDPERIRAAAASAEPEPPTPAAPDGAALWAAIKPHAVADHQFWAQLTRHHAPNPKA